MSEIRGSPVGMPGSVSPCSSLSLYVRIHST